MSETLKKITTRAKAIRKRSPEMVWTDCIKKAASELRKAPAAIKKAVGKVKKTATKKAAPARKVKVKIKPATVTIGRPRSSQAKDWGKETVKTAAKKSGLRLVHGYETEARRLSGVSMDELDHNILHLHNLEKIQASTKEMLKDKRHKPDWAALRRQLAKNTKIIAATKKHITALKSSI